MSRRYRARKARREAWYDERANVEFTRQALRGWVPPPPHPDEYHLLPVLDIREIHTFTEDEWEEGIARVETQA